MSRVSGVYLPLFVLQVAVTVNCALGQERESAFLNPVTPAQLESAYLHGTIDVVVSTREGFVLATDSRGTREGADGALSISDDQQKSFPIGKRGLVL